MANNDTAQTRPGEAVTINVLANDKGSNLTIESFQERTANGGRVTKTTDDRLLYRPGASFLGTDFFTYIAENADGLRSKSGTVTVTVL